MMKYRKIIISLLTTLILLSSFSVTVAISVKTEISLFNNNKKSDDLIHPTIDFYVDDDGGADYTKIQDAINQSSDGFTIFVYNGTYYENITINKSITLIGENKNSTIIDGSYKDYCTVVVVLADFVNLSSFTIQNSGFSFEGIENGILITSNFNNIENCIIRNCWDGIYLHDFLGSTIKNNKIKGNIFTNIREVDISCNRADNNIISENFLTKGIILLGNSNNNTIYRNGFSGGSISQFGLSKANNNTISYNSFSKSSEVCFSVKESNNNIIHHNNFKNIKIWGIRLEDSHHNSIHHNNFIKCLIKASFVQSTFNKWRQNYWGRPRLLPKVISGRVGRFLGIIPWLNIDWRPALKPNKIDILKKVI